MDSFAQPKAGRTRGHLAWFLSPRQSCSHPPPGSLVNRLDAQCPPPGPQVIAQLRAVGSMCTGLPQQHQGWLLGQLVSLFKLPSLWVLVSIASNRKRKNRSCDETSVRIEKKDNWMEGLEIVLITE